MAKVFQTDEQTNTTLDLQFSRAVKTRGRRKFCYLNFCKLLQIYEKNAILHGEGDRTIDDISIPLPNFIFIILKLEINIMGRGGGLDTRVKAKKLSVSKLGH